MSLFSVVTQGNGSTYFFCEGSYTRHNVARKAADRGYPKRIEQGWPGVWKDGVEAVVLWPNGKMFFFRGDEYVRYDVTNDRADPGYPKKISRGWPGVWKDGIDAGVVWPNGKAYFFRGDEYVRYDVALDRADEGYPMMISQGWPGVWKDGIDAVTLVSDTRAYFFKGEECLEFDVEADRPTSGGVKKTDAVWPGVGELASPKEEKDNEESTRERAREAVTEWKPENTWVIYASLVEGHFDPEGRRDHEYVQVLREAGVRAEQLVALLDEDATAQKILAAIASVGKKARAKDVLLFIFSGHGGLQENARGRGFTNSYTVEGEDALTSQDVLDAIHRHFRGSLAVMIADNCYSGATVDNVKEHRGALPVAALSSTASFDVSWTGWLLIAQLIWLAQGSAWLDADGDGAVTLGDFFRFVEEEMALVRGFKPCWHLPDGVDPIVHRGLSARVHARQYQRVLAPRDGTLTDARILSVDTHTGTAQVQWLDRFGLASSEVPLGQCTATTWVEHEVGTRVAVSEGWSQANKKGGEGIVVETFKGLHLVRFDDRPADDSIARYDWVPYELLQAL